MQPLIYDKRKTFSKPEIEGNFQNLIKGSNKNYQPIFYLGLKNVKMKKRMSPLLLLLLWRS